MSTKKGNGFAWLWWALTALVGGMLTAIAGMPVETHARVLTDAQKWLRTGFNLLLGEKGELSALITDGIIEWLALALGFIMLTWFAWLVACRNQKSRRFRALLPALYVGALIAAVCSLLPVLFYAQPINLNAFLFRVSGVLVTVVLLAVYWFCWEKFPKLVNAETVSYVVFGLLTTVVNLVAFNVCNDSLRLSTFWSTSIAWVVAVIFAYVVNKLFVFHSHTSSFGALCKEAFLFFFARFLTYFIDVGGMLLLVDVLGLGGGLSKILCNILVLILNYIFSKLFIFKGKKK